jgi:cation diffusion facilitator CzcD-associated flavoprotein CzcO
MNVVHVTDSAARLALLEARVAAEWRMLSYATKPWVRPRQRGATRLHDVVIIGGGQSGLVLSTALRRHGVPDVVVLDRAAADAEGVWENFARMRELRSPKDITGAECGLPSLCIQSWYEAKHGRAAWDAIERVPREDWAAFLRWYRRAVDAPVRNGVTVRDIVPEADAVTLHLDVEGRAESLLARSVVLATGMEGGGAWRVPETIAGSLPAHRYNHTSDPIDIAALAGKRIGVLGAGAAGFDLSVAALGMGAARVEMHMRRAQLPIVDLAREFEIAGLLEHFPEAPDALKWSFSAHARRSSQSPPIRAFAEATSYANFRIIPASPWLAAREEAGEIAVETPRGRFTYDHLIAATGAVVEMEARPELRSLAPRVLRWADRFTPPPEDPAPERARMPYLQRTYQFAPRDPDDAGVERIFAFNALAGLSMGPMAALSISGHRFGVPRLVRGITGLLWREQQQDFLAELSAYAVPAVEVPPHVQAMLSLAGD